jgi:hypothetical protein
MYSITVIGICCTPPSLLANTVTMPTFLPLSIFLLSVSQVDALPILADGNQTEDNSNDIGKILTFFSHFFLVQRYCPVRRIRLKLGSFDRYLLKEVSRRLFRKMRPSPLSTLN